MVTERHGSGAGASEARAERSHFLGRDVFSKESLTTAENDHRSRDRNSSEVHSVHLDENVSNN